MEWNVYLAFLAAAAVIILIPGPTNLVIVSDSMKSGFRRSLWTVVGAAVSHTLFIVLATAGVGTLLAIYPRVFSLLKWFGVLYLAWMGTRLLVKKSSPAALPDPGAIGWTRGRHLARGFLVNSTNPKALLFYAALFPPFVNPAAPFIPQLLALAATFLSIFILVGLLHAVLGAKAKDFLAKGRNRNLGDKIAGSIMIGAAVWLAVR